MGEEKALVEFRGRPLIENALEILRSAELSASIAGANSAPVRSALEAFAPVVQDLDPGLGPLGGICAAMASTSARWSVFIPVDMPLLPASLVEFVVNYAVVTDSLVTVASVTNISQTFPAVLERSVLPGLHSELVSGRRGCFSALQGAAAGLGKKVAVLAAELLAQSGHVAHPDGLPPACWFLNVNSVEDLRRARAYATSEG